MCLYVDYDGSQVLEDTWRTARKEHLCSECGRTIDAGERYRYWVMVGGEWYDGLSTHKMCTHCWATIELGVAFTGCEPYWYYGEIHNADDEEMGFVGNMLNDPGHNLNRGQRLALLKTVAGAKRKWRREDGTLLPLPMKPKEVKANAVAS